MKMKTEVRDFYIGWMTMKIVWMVPYKLSQEIDEIVHKNSFNKITVEWIFNNKNSFSSRVCSLCKYSNP